MKIGYSFWGFLADIKMENGKMISTPDGNAFYSWSIIHALLMSGHEVYRMMPDRDEEAVEEFGKSVFSSFAKEKRYNAYKTMIDEWPDDLDVLLMEWRFPIPGRNCAPFEKYPAGSLNYQPDLDMQNAMIDKYANTKTKIIVFDLDYKITKEDEKKLNPYCIFETSNRPKNTSSKRIPVDIPFDFEEMNTFEIKPADPMKHIAYVGNRYERDRMVEEYLVPSNLNIHLYGNWLEGDRNSFEKWPDFIYHDRISLKDFRDAYYNACATILLAKDEYLRAGFMTARILESIFFGTIPIGLNVFYQIEKYLPEHLIITEPDEIRKIVNKSIFDYAWRIKIIKELRNNLDIMDCRNFVKTVEEIT